MVDRDNFFGDGERERIRETDSLLWLSGTNYGASGSLGINQEKPRAELSLNGVQFIDGGVFSHIVHINNANNEGVPHVMKFPNNLSEHPFAGHFDSQFGIEHKNVPGIVMPQGVGIYSISLKSNLGPQYAESGLTSTMPLSNLIHHKEEKGEIEIGDPFSGRVNQMNFFLGGRGANGFLFNPHGCQQPGPDDANDPLGGPFNTILTNPTPTLAIVPGSGAATSDGFGGRGTVGIRYGFGKLQGSNNAFLVRGTAQISDALVVGRVNDGGVGADSYNPLLPNDAAEIEISNDLSGPFQFEVHHSVPVGENSLANENSAMRFRVSDLAALSTYHVNFLQKEDGFTIYNDALASRNISFKTIQTITSSVADEPANYVPTDRLHINNQTGTVTIGTGLLAGNQQFGTVEETYSDNVYNQTHVSETDQKLVVWGRTRMHGKLHITGSSTSDASSNFDGPFPLFKVEASDPSVGGDFIAEISSADTSNTRILKLSAGDTDSTSTRYISFFDGDEAEIGKIRQNGANSVVLDSPSDKRLKTNIKSTNELDKLLKLNPVTFDWKKSGKSDIGLIAQEVDKVYPHLVNKENEDKFFMNYSGLIPVLLSGIKEQQEIINNLEERIKKLENK